MQNCLLSIDPGYDRCGIAVINTKERNGVLLYSNCIRTKKTDKQEKRLATIYSELQQIIKEWNITTIALETLFFSINKKTALKVAEARGIIMLLAGQQGLPLVELSPQEVKLSVTGIGNASKTQVAKMVRLICKNLSDKTIDDEIDAIALGFGAVAKMKSTEVIRLH